MDEVPSCDVMKIQTTGSSYDEVIDAFVGFGNIRDIPDFSLSKTGKVDDGYLPQEEEAALYEDVLSAWPRLRPWEQMAYIGSATWATSLVKELLSDLDMTKSTEDNGSIGPSASQVGAASEDTPSSRGMQETSTFADNAAWKTAYNEVTSEQDVAPRCADWANQVAKEACTEETGKMEGHFMSVGHPTEVNNNVQVTIPAQVVASDDHHTLVRLYISVGPRL